MQNRYKIASVIVSQSAKCGYPAGTVALGAQSSSLYDITRII